MTQATCSPEIRPLQHLHTGPGSAGPTTWTFEDNSIAIYPKLANGQSVRVVIIRRKIIGSNGATLHACKNAGKWSFRINYAFSTKATRMSAKRFFEEGLRMGCGYLLTQMISR